MENEDKIRALIETYIKSHRLQPDDIFEEIIETNVEDGGCRIDLHGYSVQDARKYVIDIIKNIYPIFFQNRFFIVFYF